MAAGDVTIIRDVTFHDGMAGRVRLLWGTVQLDGSNPTPVTLTNYVQAIDQAVVSIDGSSAPGLDPQAITSSVSGTTINVYAWQAVSAANCTLTASTNNARLVNWMAIGPKV